MSLKAAIIGAGISGLLTIKQCLEDGIEPVCFETQDHFGGQWRYTEPDPKTGEVVSSIYRSVVINTSRDTTMMSDFPMNPKDYTIYAHNSKVQQYFESYADFFKLRSYIQFRHRVISVVPHPTVARKWLVKVESGETVTEGEYDAVFVCTGHHSNPNTPNWEGVENFQGQLLHGHYYRDTTKYLGKNVAVVGVGNSGVDISAELSTCTNETHLITRSGTWVFPRFIFGKPYESLGTRFVMTLLPRLLARVFTELLLLLTMGSIPPVMKPKHNLGGAHPTVRSDLFERINTGTITPHRASISRFTENGIEMTNGEVIEPLDAVIACTGYQLKYPFLTKELYQSAEDDGNWVNLFRLVTPPDCPGLFFIGLCQALGPLFPVAEIQTRWATALLKSEIPYPPTEKMKAEIEHYKNHIKKDFVESPRHTIETDFFGYMDPFAEDIGVKPTLMKFIKTFGFWKGLGIASSVYFGPPSGIHYRFFGKGKKPELARLTAVRIAKGNGEEMSAEEVKELEKYRPTDR